MAHVEMYTTQTCGYCTRAKRLLAKYGVTPEELDVSFDLGPMVQRTHGAMTVPQIFIDNVHIGGYDKLAALERDGRLEPLLYGGSAGHAEPPV